MTAPREPTKEMLAQGRVNFFGNRYEDNRLMHETSLRSLWRAMYDAAPPEPAADALSHAWKSGYAQAKEERGMERMFCPHCNPCLHNGNEKCRAPAPDADGRPTAQQITEGVSATFGGTVPVTEQGNKWTRVLWISGWHAGRNTLRATIEQQARELARVTKERDDSEKAHLSEAHELLIRARSAECLAEARGRAVDAAVKMRAALREYPRGLPINVEAVFDAALAAIPASTPERNKPCL